MADYHVRQRVVANELYKLEKGNYIDNRTYKQILSAHKRYYEHLEEAKGQPKEDQGRQSVKQEQYTGQEETSIPSNSVQETSARPESERVQPQPKKVKKSLSSKEIRERNITWSLILGVILLLIGGTVLATSTWDMMGPLAKTGMIALVSLLFFGLAYFTRVVLKIEKTAFAFHVLGALFLPIVIISAGYFELFGRYFSFSGEGRFLFGAAGSLVILPVYLLLAIRLASRLFVWFSYVVLTLFAGFAIASLKLPVDGYYLGIMLFNGALIFGCHYLNKYERFKLFTKEFVVYIQANLILSTVLMLTLYDHELVHGYNLMLTAVLYFFMIFVTSHKGYHFVFSAMLVYGAYQLIEFSALDEGGAVIYALLGFVFLALPKYLEGAGALQKAFRVTSAVVSVLAFLYISFEGILLRMNEPSMVLLIAYIIITANFVFLTNQAKRPLFAYLSASFMMSALYEAVLICRDMFGFESMVLPVFIAGLFLYIVFGCRMNAGFLDRVKPAARDVGGVVMFFCVISGYVVVSPWQLGVMFLLLAVAALEMDRFENRKSLIGADVAAWIHAVALGFAAIAFLSDSKVPYLDAMDAANYVFAGLVMLVVSMVWKKTKRNDFHRSTFFAAQGFYFYGLVMTFGFAFDDVLRTLVVLGGVGMAYLVYRKTNWPAIPYVISTLSLLVYFTALYAIYIEADVTSDLFRSLQFIFGALLLLGTGVIIGKRDRWLMKSFLLIGHLYLPLSVLFTFLFSGEQAVWAFLIATAVYAMSVWKAKPDAVGTVFLYFCVTSFWAAVSLGFILLEFDALVHYAFFITSGVAGAAWVLSGSSWDRKIAYYAVPFSTIGMIAFLSVQPFALLPFVVLIGYTIGLLYMMHMEKWDFFNLAPLILLYIGVIQFCTEKLTFENAEQLGITVFAVMLTIAGFLLYRIIFRNPSVKQGLPVMDWYTIVGVLAMISLYIAASEVLWTQLLPGLLLFGNLLLQRKRIPLAAPKWVVFAACVFLLQPYYTVLGNISLPDLLERELYVLPWVVLGVLFRKIDRNMHKSAVTYTEWSVLVIVALLLVQDGMASSTIYDALIIGVLSLASMLAGTAFQLKSYFFVGAGVLLLNVFLQTRPYWGNLPWWGYLLIAGSILITVASYNEWHKQKTANGKQTLLSVFRKKVVQKIKKWD
ncbi:hypothetical protein GCM10009001_25360 [Virgibacillus siamensis]|uniref:DUF2157 domain-containing protein n=1 Tax=Virgibacillus siamensis TaxID=480071 RepID=A0ABP3RGR7_9BACI